MIGAVDIGDSGDHRRWPTKGSSDNEDQRAGDVTEMAQILWQRSLSGELPPMVPVECFGAISDRDGEVR